MKLYIDKRYNLYSNLKLKNKITKVSAKEVLKSNPKLIIKKDVTIIKEYSNIQCLYLYPLSLIDYVDNLNKFIFINILKLDLKCDYMSIFERKEYKNLKCVEFLIDDNLEKNELDKIIKIICYLINRDVKINLNIKNINNIDDSFISIFNNIDYYKIFLPNFKSKDEYEIYLEKLKILIDGKNASSLIHIKTYLNIMQSKYYENILNDLNNLKVDIFQISKELQPLNRDNIMVDLEVQNNIRELEKKYNTYEKTKFLSVKDITCLYYPRFILDERNSKICYACRMKPYFKGNRLLPCKVKKITNSLDSWSSSLDVDITDYNSKIKKCGNECDDCASIFENDILCDIEDVLCHNEDADVLLEVEM